MSELSLQQDDLSYWKPELETASLAESALDGFCRPCICCSSRWPLMSGGIRPANSAAGLPEITPFYPYRRCGQAQIQASTEVMPICEHRPVCTRPSCASQTAWLRREWRRAGGYHQPGAILSLIAHAPIAKPLRCLRHQHHQ